MVVMAGDSGATPGACGKAPYLAYNGPGELRGCSLFSFQALLLRELRRRPAGTRARARGARTLWLGVWEHNPRAMAFYRKFGLEVVGTHAFMLGLDRQRDLIMSVKLG